MLRGKLKSAALQSAMSTLSSSIESVRRLASLTPVSDRESEPTSRMSRRPSAPGVQPDRSGAWGHTFGLTLAVGPVVPDGELPGVDVTAPVPVGVATAPVGVVLAPGVGE